MDEINGILKFLKTNSFHDILMPVSKGNKYPMYPHKNNEWTAQKLNEFINIITDKMKYNYDWCILLKDLCVIDFDIEDKYQDFLQKFPIINQCPLEKTNRGYHVWFKRSEYCNENCYYDGCAQIAKGVDFKTITKSGTGGVIIIAPSTGKKWIRSLLITKLQEIPNDLLNAVAISKKTEYIVRTYQFIDKIQELEIDKKLLEQMTYFEPYFDDFTDIIHVPFKSDEFAELIHYFNETKVNSIDIILRVANFLGYTKMQKLTHKLLLHKLYWQDMDPKMKAALMNNSELLPVTPITYRKETGYFRDSLLLTNPSISIAEGHEIISEQSIKNMEANLNKTVLEILRKYPAVLAGGSVAGMLASTLKKWSDYDIYLYGDEKTANLILKEITSTLLKESRWRCSVKTSRAITFHIKSTEHPIQIIFLLSWRPQDIINSFDIAPSRVGAWFEEGKFVIKGDPSFFVAMESLSFPIELDTWSQSATYRYIKYVVKGFTLYLPGMRKHYIEPPKSDETHLLGVLGLWTVADYCLKNKISSIKKELFHANSILRKLRGKITSNYDVTGNITFHPWRNSYAFNTFMYLMNQLRGVIWGSHCTEIGDTWYHPNLVLWSSCFKSNEKIKFFKLHQKIDEFNIAVANELGIELPHINIEQQFHIIMKHYKADKIISTKMYNHFLKMCVNGEFTINEIKMFLNNMYLS